MASLVNELNGGGTPTIIWLHGFDFFTTQTNTLETFGFSEDVDSGGDVPVLTEGQLFPRPDGICAQ